MYFPREITYRPVCNDNAHVSQMCFLFGALSLPSPPVGMLFLQVPAGRAPYLRTDSAPRPLSRPDFPGHAVQNGCFWFYFVLFCFLSLLLCHYLLYINMLNGFCSFLPFKIEEPETSWFLLYSYLVGTR